MTLKKKWVLNKSFLIPLPPNPLNDTLCAGSIGELVPFMVVDADQNIRKMGLIMQG